MKKYEGLVGAGGQAIGKVVRLEKKECVVRKQEISNAEEEISRFKEIQARYSEELDELYDVTLERLGQDSAEIFRAYKMIANDQYFFDNAIHAVTDSLINIDYAIEQEKIKTCALFADMPDQYMRERAADIENVCNELIARLNGIISAENMINKAEEPFIVVAKDLTPADTVRIDKTYLRGFVTEKGGVTSHVVILAKTLGIPAIVGVDNILDEVESGNTIYVNGTEGYAVYEPDEEFTRAFAAEKEKLDAQKRHFAEMAKKEISTLDGHKVHVCVNSGDADSMDSFRMDSCDGVGLFRTEFLYMNERNYPTEDAQFEVYRKMAEKLEGKELIIRTLDIGGDKQLDYMELPKEDNPFLGYRAIRLCLDRTDVFKTQLRALLRASTYGNMKIMFPMIVTVEELRAAKALLAEAKEELRAEGKAFREDVPVGIMIETPAAVLISDKLAKEADFFSIGTNDLIQYTTATDRMNERVQYLYTSRNLSVLAAIRKVIENGHKENIPVGMCGEAASDEKLAPLLLGMGLDEFSMVPSQVGKVKSLLSGLKYEEMRELVQKVLEKQTIAEVEELLESVHKTLD